MAIVDPGRAGLSIDISNEALTQVPLHGKETNVRTSLRFITSGAATSVAFAVALALSSATYRAQSGSASASKLRFDVSFVPQVHEGPITGRAFVMVTRSIDKQPE